jgi:hypothetical protein
VLTDDLITEYRVFRHAVRLGERKDDLSDVTPREHAGMYLSMFGASALGNFDQVTHVTSGTLSHAAEETRQLIQEALAEEETEADS